MDEETARRAIQKRKAEAIGKLEAADLPGDEVHRIWTEILIRARWGMPVRCAVVTDRKACGSLLGFLHVFEATPFHGFFEARVPRDMASGATLVVGGLTAVDGRMVERLHLECDAGHAWTHAMRDFERRAKGAVARGSSSMQISAPKGSLERRSPAGRFGSRRYP